MGGDVGISKLIIVNTHLACRRIEDPVVPTPAPLTRNVCVENRWRNADRCCGSAEEVAHIVGYAVEIVGSVLEATRQLFRSVPLKDLVHEDKVMCWASGTLEGGVRL